MPAKKKESSLETCVGKGRTETDAVEKAIDLLPVYPDVSNYRVIEGPVTKKGNGGWWTATYRYALPDGVVDPTKAAKKSGTGAYATPLEDRMNQDRL